MSTVECQDAPVIGRLILNADDWGRNAETTDRILECVLCGTVSSVSAMVFMEDSARAAALAREQTVDAGLHLNFTAPFTFPGCPTDLVEHQERITRYLRGHRLAQTLFHPGLRNSFQYVVAAQLEEFRRLYGKDPSRIDGHHHMHLCANVVFGNLLPSGTIVRRNFTFSRGQKGLVNRAYRRLLDGRLRRRYRLSDYLFALPPLDPPGRLQEIFSLANRFVVEVETHPVNADEYRFLTRGGILRLTGDLPIASGFGMASSNGPN
jgi:predicted glycoside hydrolase/deacetylase ChbG (UPF0249 family)